MKALAKKPSCLATKKGLQRQPEAASDGRKRFRPSPPLFDTAPSSADTRRPKTSSEARKAEFLYENIIFTQIIHQILIYGRSFGVEQ
jgi:hypothetical protein